MQTGRQRIRSNEWMKPAFGWPVMLLLLGGAWWLAVKFGADNPANWPGLLEEWKRDYARDPVPFYIAAGSAVVLVFMFIKLVVDTVSLARFGVISLEPDPDPGCIAGHVGGSIRLGYAPRSDDVVTVTVVCWRHYVRRTRNKSETATERHWSVDIHPEIGREFNQSVIRFTADIPGDLPPSGKLEDDTFRWQVLLRVERSGRDIVRAFTIPVERRESPLTATRPMRDDVQSPVPVRGMTIIEEGTRLVVEGHLGRSLGMNLLVMLFGGVFTGAGLFLGIGVAWDHAQELLAGNNGLLGILFSSMFVLIPGFMALVFFLIGALILLAGLASLLNRRRMVIDAAELHTRNWFGSERIPVAEVEHFEIAESGSMGTQTQHDLYAVPGNGQPVKVLEGVPGQLAAREIAGRVSTFTGRTVKDVGKRNRLSRLARRRS